MKSYVPFKPIALVQKALAATVLIASVGLPVSAQTPSIVANSTNSTSSQDYPNRPIKIVVAFTPGSSNDVYARVVAEKLQERFGQPVIVENKPGAAGTIGAGFVAKSAPDGYTLLLATGALTVTPWVYKSLPFDVEKSFAPVGIGVTQPLVVVVTNILPVKSINELIAYAKEHPGKLFFGSSGIGSTMHLSAEWFKGLTGINMVHVPYKGATDVLTALMTGQVQVMFSAFASAAPYMKSGKIRAIAVAERQRLPQFKDVPTVNESVPGFETNLWFGLVAPAGTPDAILNKLSEAQRAIVNMPDVRDRLARLEMDSNPSSAAELRQLMTTEVARWGKIMKTAGIELQ